MNPNPAKLAGFDLEDKATDEILPNWQDFKLLGYLLCRRGEVYSLDTIISIDSFY